MSKESFKKNININNRKASFEYQLLQKYIVGIVLKGTEIKSIRLGKVSLGDGYCYFQDNELWVKQMHIAPYKYGTIYNHEETRARKLLLKKNEIKKLLKTKEKGMTIIPTRLFINERGFAKLEIALAKGKKLYDKRESIKEKDILRQNQKAFKNY
ncbi:MAG: SsrA-binding protein SmpB [Bacteroidetes bacterium]|nr:SsrA-binding protein SmpB [Bacteroidota bacterium]